MEITKIVEQLIDNNTTFVPLERQGCEKVLPNRETIIEITDLLRSVLFPGYIGFFNDLTPDNLPFHLGATLDNVRRLLFEQVTRGFCFACSFEEQCDQCKVRAEQVIESFMQNLPHIHDLLVTDVTAHYNGDPAAKSKDEIIFCYPGLTAVTYYRIAHELYKLNVPLLPRIITEQAHTLTGIDIHPGARIDSHFFIDHGTGVVIGETSEIGKHVRIYQGVTLGAKSFPLDEQGKPIKGIKRHPKVEDNVIIYSGATILGNITIGASAIIGGNVWITRDVHPGTRITQREPRLESYADGSGI